MKEAPAIIADLENAPGIIVPLVREVPPAVVKRRPRPGKWSAHEHACHLASVHPLFFERLDRMLREPAPPRITPYLPHEQMEDGALLQVDLDEALAQFCRDRRRLVERLQALSDSDWERTAEHAEYSHYSVRIMFRHLALHDRFHAYRIEQLLLKKDWDS